MKENKNNEIQMDSLEQVAGGGDPIFENLIKEIDDLTKKGFDMLDKAKTNYDNEQMSYEEYLKVLEEAGKLRNIVNEKYNQLSALRYSKNKK